MKSSKHKRFHLEARVLPTVVALLVGFDLACLQEQGAPLSAFLQDTFNESDS